MKQGGKMPKVKKNLKRIIVEIDEEEEKFIPPRVEYPVSKDELIELYYDKQLSTTEIAEYLGRGATTVRRWMDNFDIPRRDYSQATILHHKKIREIKNAST
jgi:hypothetical protein